MDVRRRPVAAAARRWLPSSNTLRSGVTPLVILIGAALAVPLCQSISRADAPRKPNIVFILAADLGYTDLACYGSTYYETPHIDRLASQGLKFTSGYTCGPNCQPTRAALLSGRYDPRTGIYFLLQPGKIGAFTVAFEPSVGNSRATRRVLAAPAVCWRARTFVAREFGTLWGVQNEKEERGTGNLERQFVQGLDRQHLGQTLLQSAEVITRLDPLHQRRG